MGSLVKDPTLLKVLSQTVMKKFLFLLAILVFSVIPGQVFGFEATSDCGGENCPPLIEGPTFASTTLGSLLEFPVVASDPDGDLLTIEAHLPEGAEFSTTTNFFSWTPFSSGNFVAEFQASDGSASTSLAISIEVIDLESRAEYNLCADINRDGLLSRADLEAFVDYIFRGGVPRVDVDYDLNDDSYPDVIDVTILIDYLYRDGSALTCLGEPNLPPVFVNFNPPTSTLAAELYSYDVEASDSENDSLTFDLLEAPRGMGINASSGLISWTPDVTQASSTPYSILVEVSDGRSYATSSFSLIVNLKTNPPSDNGGSPGGGGAILQIGGVTPTSTPTSSPSSGLINLPPYFADFNPPQTASAGNLYLYDVEAVDPEGQPLIFSLVSGPTGVTVVFLNGLVVWIPTIDQISGTPHLITLSVSDGLNSTTTSFEVLVQGVPPVVPVPPLPSGTLENESPEPLNETAPVSLPSPTAPPETETENETTLGNENQNFLLAGAVNFLGDFGDWLLSYPLILIIILLSLVGFLILLPLFKRKEKGFEPSLDAIPSGAVEMNGDPIVVIPKNESETQYSGEYY